MARILFRGNWFETVQPDGIFENDFESILLSSDSTLYPDYNLVKFKYSVESEFGIGRPDLALISKDYSSWWVVEVELGSHSLRGHVERQVAIFSSANYNIGAAHYLSSQHSHLDIRALQELMLGASPRVLVIVNQHRPDWAQALLRWDALVAVVELYRDQNNTMIMRVDGEHPRRDDTIVSTCRIDRHMRQSLVIDSPAMLELPNGGRVDLWFDGGITQWKRVDSKTTTWLMPVFRCPLSISSGVFQIVRSESGLLILQSQNTLKRSFS